MSHLREDLAKIGQETAKILDQGFYQGSKETIFISGSIKNSVSHSVLYEPDSNILPGLMYPFDPNVTPITVTPETTLAAAKRLKEKGYENVVALNFASARHPGGGWLSGAPAQEESLARASGLVPTLTKFPQMYDFNDQQGSALYSDYMIYSPYVSVFRDDDHNFLDVPYHISFITSPAPNLGALQKNAPQDVEKVDAIMDMRIRKILAIASIHKADALVLGAFGCGVFKNDPNKVAAQFKDILTGTQFSNRFKEIVFGVYDKSPGETTLKVFKSILE